MQIERDVEIPMSDGVVLRADVFRPDGDGTHPVLISYGGYGKGLHLKDGYPGAWEDIVNRTPDVLEGSSGEHMVWELPDPEFWVPVGYILIRVDARGTGMSPGLLNNMSPQEGDDIYECVEWAAAQPWSTGRVGLSGISYMAIVQWFAACRQPPHLDAICVWEGAADWYRDVSWHGGILSTFPRFWFPTQVLPVQYGIGSRGRTSPTSGLQVSGGPELSDEGLAQNRVDPSVGMAENPFDGEVYRERSLHPERQRTPLLSAANWGGQGLHLRGNIEGFVHSATEQKWLEVHGDNHWANFYRPAGRELQKRFYDHFLCDTGDWLSQPPVQLEVRHPGERFETRFEDAWPIPRTQWTEKFLDVSEHALVDAVPSPGQQSYAALGEGVTFLTATLEGKTEITGPLAATLWISSSTTDADIFLVLRLFDSAGEEVLFRGSVDPAMPLTLGWLRASHRAVDPQRSEPYRPFHPHDHAEPLDPGVPYELQIEVLPTCIVAPAGYRLGLTVLGRDFDHGQPEAVMTTTGLAMSGVGPFRHDGPTDRPAEIFDNEVTIYTGPDHPSRLLVPIIPPES